MRTEHLRAHVELDADNWWFTARRRIVLSQLDAWLERRGNADDRGLGRDLRILDLGCGAGANLHALRRYGSAIGVEPDADAANVARARSGAEVRAGSLPDALPFDDERFDVITLLDVLEHVEDDSAALDTIARLLAPDGLLIVTVPAFQFLWSRHDVANEHFRRYTRTHLMSKLEQAHLVVRKASYYNTFLFPPIAFLRLLSRFNRGATHADTGRMPVPFNTVLSVIFGAERHVLRYASLPFGVSLIALAEPVAVNAHMATSRRSRRVP